MQKKGPIGVFDSGVGGTSIWSALLTELPNESTIYLADSKNAPYGERSPEEIIRLSHKNTRYLLNQGCKLIVVACNTATTNAIAELRSTYDRPFIGIEPAIKPAALQTKTGAIGILATRGTLSSKLFSETAARFTKDLKVVEVIGSGLVPLIEAGKLDSSEMHELLSSHLAPMLAAKVDSVVLGCSHYPYLIPLLQQLLPPDVKIIDSGIAVARQTHRVLVDRDLLTEEQQPSHQILINKKEGVPVLQDLLSEISQPMEIIFREF